MILNYYGKIKVDIDDLLVGSLYHDRFKEVPFFDQEPKYTLTIKAVDKINTKQSIDVSVYMKYDEDNIYLCDKNGKICQSLFGRFDLNEIVLVCERGYDYSALLDYIIKPFLRYSLIKCGMAFIHASSFSMDNENILVPAWAHTGKTAMLLSALKNGGHYFGDDLSVISAEGEMYPYVVPINLFDYNFKNNKSLKVHLTAIQRIKMNSAKLIAKVFYLGQKISKSSKMKYLFYAGKTFFEASMHVSVFADQIFPGSCDSSQGSIGKVIFLERSQELSRNKCDHFTLEVLVDRFQHCINYEFQRFNEIITTAKWTPYYSGDKTLELKERDVYIRCFKNQRVSSVVIPNNQNFDELLGMLCNNSSNLT